MKKIVLISLGIVTILITVLLVGFIGEGFYLHQSYLDPWNPHYYTRYDDPRTQIIAHGILAANGHNMQNWKFRYDPNNENAFDMYLETSRLVTNVDPYYTQATISQGTLSEYMTVAGRKLGYNVTIDLFPDGEYTKNATFEELQQKRVAHVILEAADKQEDPLYAGMFRPDTSRIAYEKNSVSQTDVDALTARNTYPDIRVMYVANGEKYEKLQKFIIDSARTETGVERVMAESGNLFRVNEREKNAYRYGFSFEGSGISGLTMHALQALLTLFPGMNSPDALNKTFLDQTNLAAENNSGFFLIVSSTNNRVQQFHAGVLYSKMQLKAGSLSLAIQPLTQSIEEYPEMMPTHNAIHKEMVNDGETIQMLFRIGKPTAQVPGSMRKDVGDFIVKTTVP